MPVIKASLTALIDTDAKQITLVTPKQDAEQLATQVSDLIRFRGGLPGFRNPMVKAMTEATIMNWVSELVRRGWVNFIPDSKDWKIILKRGD